MPRKPTGRPTGRPPGSGKLGDHTRLTVRIPRALYERLDTYAAGRSFTRGTPQLAICIREALEVYLDSKRQTKSIPLSSAYIKSLPENNTAPARDEIWQPENILHLHGDILQQTRSVPELSVEKESQSIRQTESEQVSSTPRPLDAADLGARPGAPVVISQQPAQPALDFDTSKYYLGKLCPRAHDYQGIGQSVLTIKGQRCRLCDAEKKREKRAAQRQAAPVA